MTQKSSSIPQLKILLTGDTFGKTSFLNRFTKDAFDSNVMATIGAYFTSKTILCDDYDVKLEIWDTTGQERVDTLASLY